MKKQSLKKWAVLGLVTLGLTTSGTAFAASQTLYYRGTPVYWEHGRIAGVWSIFINIVQLQTAFGLDGKVGVL